MKLTRWLIFVTSFSLPLYILRCKNFAFCQDFSPLPFTFLEVLILATFAAWIYWKYTEIKKGKETVSRLLQRLRTPFLLPIVLFLLSGVIGTFVSSDLRGALGILKAYFVEGFLLYLVVYDFLIITNNLRFILFSLISSAFWLAIFAIVEAFLGISPFAPQELLRGRVSALYSTSNAIGLLLAPVLAFIFGWLLFELKFTKQSKFWVILLLSLALVSLGIYVSGSRGALLGLSLTALFYLVYFVSRGSKLLQKALPKIFLVVSVISLFGLLVFFLNIGSFTPERPSRGTFLSRPCLWEGAKNLIFDRPLVGSGLNDFRETQEPYRTCSLETYQYPHNILLNFWTQTGFLGVVSFFWLGILLSFKLLSVQKNKLIAVSLVASLVAIFGHGLVDVPFFKNDLSAQFWFLVAVGSYLVSFGGRGGASLSSNSSLLGD